MMDERIYIAWGWCVAAGFVLGLALGLGTLPSSDPGPRDMRVDYIRVTT